jgi:tetratricopeptide (TPR) repeat protein
VKRALAVSAVMALLAAGAALVQRLDRERLYRQLLAEGELALAAGQSQAAIEAFTGAIAVRPDSMVAHYRRGEAYRHERQDDRAIRDLQTARRLAPDAPQPLVVLGELYDARGEPAQAAEWYAQAADRLHDADATLLYSLALARYRSGVPVSARDPLRRALARDDSIAEAHYLLGLVHSDANQVDEAILSLERAVRLVPGMIPAREELADLYRTQDQPDEELRHLRALAELDPQRDRQIAIALAEARDDRFADALATLAAAAAGAPNDSRIDLALGRIRLGHAERTGDRHAIAAARAALERALGGTAPRSEGLALFGRALYLSGDIVAAERILLEAIATSPVDPEAFAFLADAAERLSHPGVARDALLDLNALEGSTAPAELRAARARRIGALSLAQGDPRTALEFLNHAVAAGHGDAQTLGLLARARWQTGDPAGARDALGRAIALNSRDVELQRLLRAIR